ncbi:MAG: amidohydrolase family protein [bacterium]|nr:amidohydrolase family protein [bacterium]
MAVALEDTQTTTEVSLIDCDIHNGLKTLKKFLPNQWQDYHTKFGRRSYTGKSYPKSVPSAARTDAWPPDGGGPGSDLPFLREQLLDTWDIGYGILNRVTAMRNHIPEYDAAFARASNACLAAEWLDEEPRLRASMITPYENGDLAAEEIDRTAEDPRFVQIILPTFINSPLGNRKYWKLFEAAVRNNLPVGIHFGAGNGGHPITGTGWPAYYLEYHCGMAQGFQHHIISLVFEGVFERFSDLKIVLIEGGMAWLPALTWRMDRAWENLKEEIPHVPKPPSEYIRKNIWLTTQPMEEPDSKEHFHQFLTQIDKDDQLLFATDYPHWDFDAPDTAFPIRLNPDLERKIKVENALNLYQF